MLKHFKQKLATVKKVIKIWLTLVKLWIDFYKWDAVLYYIFQAITPLTTILSIFVGGSFINLAVDIVQHSHTVFTPTLIKLLLLQALLWLLGVVSGSLGEYYNHKISAYRENFHDAVLGKRLATLEPVILEDPEKAQLISRISYNVWQITAISYNFIFGLMWLSIVIIITAILAHFNSIFVLGILILAALKFIINIKFGSAKWNIWDSGSDAKVKYESYISPAYSTNAEHKIYMNVLGIGKLLIAKGLKINYDFATKLKENEKKRALSLIVVELLGTLVWLGIFIILLKDIALGILSVGSFYVVYQLLGEAESYANWAFADLSNLLSDLQLHKDFYKFLQITKASTEESAKADLVIHENKNYKDITKSQLLTINKDFINSLSNGVSIEFKDVWFKYPKSSDWVLKGVSFKIDKNENVALVGRNGAGKSTIIKLIVKMYTPQKGKILINGVDLQRIPRHALYKVIGLLVQNTPRFSIVAKDIILMGRTDKNIKIPNTLKGVSKLKDIDILDSNTMKKVKDAAKLAGIHDKLKTLKQGYNTWINISVQDGVNLSGGEWQKLIMAQILYRDPKLLILDEPTSAIDALSEEKIFEKLFKYAKDKTVLIVSHRFATVKKAEKIFVLDNGKIIEQGTHEELIKLKGLYARMYESQVGE